MPIELGARVQDKLADDAALHRSVMTCAFASKKHYKNLQRIGYTL